MDYKIRPGSSDDLPFLRAMLYEAAFWRPGEDRPGIDEAFANPELAKILMDWGARDGDTAVVAEDEGKPAGAAFYRFWTEDDHSYGFVAEDIPELGIAVWESHRRRGIGRALLTALLTQAAAKGVSKVSLSVERDNPARHLYESLGFTTAGTVDNAFTMVAHTRKWAAV